MAYNFNQEKYQKQFKDVFSKDKNRQTKNVFQRSASPTPHFVCQCDISYYERQTVFAFQDKPCSESIF